MNPILAIIITNLIWGAAPPIFKYALQNIPPFTLAFIRFFFASFIFLPFAIRYWQKLSKEDYKNIFLGAFWGITLNVGFFFLGLQYAPSINVHIISSLGPIVLYFSSILMLREKPHSQIITGMSISLAGALIIILAPFFLQSSVSLSSYTASSQLIGNIFYILSMLGAVFHTVYNKKAVKKVNPFIVTCIGFMLSAFTFFPFMLFELQSWSFAQLDSRSWVGIIYGIFFSSAVAYFLHNYAVSKLHAQEIGVFTYMDPIIAIIVAIPLLGEYPDNFFILGSILVFIGIYMSEHKARRAKKLPE